MIGRREFITLLGSAAAWPVAVSAQPGERTRLAGIFYDNRPTNDPEIIAEIAAFKEALQRFGWSEGHNIRFEERFNAPNSAARRKLAKELVALKADVILTSGTPATAAIFAETRTIPIVFVGASDPIGSGFAVSLAHPDGNVTGFTNFEASVAQKWLELLKEIAPGVTRAAILRDPNIPAGIGQFASLQSVAPSFEVELSPVNVRDASEIERDVTAFARGSNGGLIVTSSGLAAVHRQLIITLAARYRLPAIYSYRYFATNGGLISYGPDPIDQYWRAAGYIDRILKGEKPADLPVQAPTKYELAINLKTAKALGLTVPAPLLARADEVFE
jgi:ABC-type uncharacterized transport system substrate-binding protein